MWEAAKRAGINISEAAERGILDALGTPAATADKVAVADVYFNALDATEREQLATAIRTGAFKEPGYFGKTRKCPDPGRLLHGWLSRKYRFTDIQPANVQLVLAKVIIPPGGPPA